MDTSATVKKSKKDKELAEISNLAAGYLSDWAQKELYRIAISEKRPILWPLEGGGYIVGTKRIVPKFGYWHLLDNNSNLEHVFETKQSAMFYCLAERSGLTWLAKDIKSYDTQVLRLKNDIFYYKASLTRALNTKQSFKIDVCMSRLNDAKMKLAPAQKRLEKFLKMTKYLHIQE